MKGNINDSISKQGSSFTIRMYKFTEHIYSDNTGFLHCENIKIKDLQSELEKSFAFSSPFFLYSKSQIEANVHSYKSALSQKDLSQEDGCLQNSTLGYSIKANYNLNILQLFNKLGCCAVTVSGMFT